MSKSTWMAPRWWAWLRALIGAYYWMPCPLCGQMYAGYEAASECLWDDETAVHGRCVCRKCGSIASARNDELWPIRITIRELRG